MGDAGAAAQPDGGDEAMIAADSAAEAAVAADGNPQFFSRRGGGVYVVSCSLSFPLSRRLRFVN
jgi:hypothetical protein